METESFAFGLKVHKPQYFTNVIVARDVIGSNICNNDQLSYIVLLGWFFFLKKYISLYFKMHRVLSNLFTVIFVKKKKCIFEIPYQFS